MVLFLLKLEIYLIYNICNIAYKIYKYIFYIFIEYLFFYFIFFLILNRCLSINKLNGSIPPEIGNLSNLQYL